MAERVVGHGSFGVVFQVNLINFYVTIYYLTFASTYQNMYMNAQANLGHKCLSLLLLLIIQAKCLETGETVAIKKVLQDKRYKNRELQTMRLLDHPNVVALKHCFFSTTEKDELYLNLVLEYVPETVHRVIKHYNKMNQRMPLIYVKLYTYQVNLQTSYFICT